MPRLSPPGLGGPRVCCRCDRLCSRWPRFLTVRSRYNAWRSFRSAVGQSLARVRLSWPGCAQPFSLGRQNNSRTCDAHCAFCLCDRAESVGLLSAYKRGWFDAVATRGAEVVLSFPSIVVILLIVSRFGSNLTLLVVAAGMSRSSRVSFGLFERLLFRLSNRRMLSAAKARGERTVYNIGSREYCQICVR